MTYRELKVKETTGTVVSVGDPRVQPHIDATTNVHGIADTSALETQSGAQAKADAALASAQSYADSAASAAAAGVVDAAPAALDTLNELAAALGDDANFATTVTNSLATKAPLASPALTGIPTAPTATEGTNTTQIATTEFVTAAVSGGVATAMAASSVSVYTYVYTCLAGQTSFTGADDNGQVLTFSGNNVMVYLNGVFLTPGVDFSASNDTVTLTVGSATNDVLAALVLG